MDVIHHSFNGYRPQFYFRTTDVTGVIELPAGTEMVMPGDNISMTIELITPIAMRKGLRFAIREGGKMSCRRYYRIIIKQESVDKGASLVSYIFMAFIKYYLFQKSVTKSDALVKHFFIKTIAIFSKKIIK